MPIRIRITLLFTTAVFIILGIVCISIYYFSASSRVDAIKRRLSNRAITTARLLRHSEIFDAQVVHRIDSLTTMTLKNKSVMAFDSSNRIVYSYVDSGALRLSIDTDILADVRAREITFFKDGRLEAVAFHDVSYPNDAVVICAAEDREGWRVLNSLLNVLVLSFISGTVISFIGGMLVSRRLLKPIRKITTEVNDISAYNLDRRIQTGSNPDEWYHLSTTLNQLLDRLKEGFELQRRFISNASHELSTPLTLISSQLEIALQRKRSSEEYEHTMHATLNDVQHMSQLVQTLLKFAMASGDTGGINIDLVRIDEILMRLPGEMKKIESDYTVSINFADPPAEENRLLVFGNEELLFSCFRNIVTNSCKFSPDHHATVDFQVTNDQFIVRISDNGRGIAPEDLTHIFQPFYRAKQSSAVKGFGLGLPLAYRIIKLHKGDIEVQSAPGEGTTVIVTLPHHE